MSGDVIELAYGRGTLPLLLPENAQPTIIRKAVLPRLADDAAARNGGIV